MLLKYLIILFVGVPLLELMLLLKIGEMCGVGFAISLVLITGLAGAILAKSQGITAWNRIQTELSEGRMPGDQLIDGLMVFAGGITLLTPGLLTDTIGLCLLVPVTRTVI
ncbi:FxsA family protein, partial [bacterium]|nr:FxsA family protein [bacterium]